MKLGQHSRHLKWTPVIHTFVDIKKKVRFNNNNNIFIKITGNDFYLDDYLFIYSFSRFVSEHDLLVKWLLLLYFHWMLNVMSVIIIIIKTIIFLIPWRLPHTISDSSPPRACCKDGVHHGGAAQQVDQRHERLAVSLVCSGLQCRPAVVLHGTFISAAIVSMSCSGG